MSENSVTALVVSSSESAQSSRSVHCTKFVQLRCRITP
jgi:hypothetical protein